MNKASYSYTREHLSSILNQIVDNSEIFCIERKNGKEIIMLEKSDYDSLVETAYLLRSPNNVKNYLKL